MRLEVYADAQRYEVEVGSESVTAAEPFFTRMDRDMDAGWQLGPEFVEAPDRVQRGQIAADRLLAALESGDQATAQAMAGYILTRLPEVRTVRVDVHGEPLHTMLETETGEALGG